MSKVCKITARGPQTGHTVSHAKNKAKRRFLPNLHKCRIWVASENRFITLNVSARGLRTIDKNGIEAILKEIKKI